MQNPEYFHKIRIDLQSIKIYLHYKLKEQVVFNLNWLIMIDYVGPVIISGDEAAIGVAISLNKTNPYGPYEDYGKPIIGTSPGVIDIHYFRDQK